MNALQKELQELKAKVAELESRILFPNEPVAKWQPKGGDFFIQSNGKASEVVGGSDILHKEFGVERPARQQAERASIEMRRFNRLLALRDELCGDEVINWDWTDGKEKYHLYFSHNNGQWLISADFYCECVMTYFTNYDSAQKACDMLNFGEVEL